MFDICVLEYKQKIIKKSANVQYSVKPFLEDLTKKLIMKTGDRV